MASRLKAPAPIKPELDKGQRGFADDVVSITEQYHAEGQPIIDELNDRVAEAKRIEAEARNDYAQAAIELNGRYIARIRQAAHMRKKRSKHPEFIDQAERTVTLMMGGTNNAYVSTQDPANAERVMLNAERERLIQERNKEIYGDTPVIW